MKALALALVLLAATGCKAKEHKPKHQPKPPTALTDVEIKRGDDACKAYIDKVCACSTQKPDNASLAEQCKLSKALPQAIEIALSVAQNPDSKPDVVEESYDSVRKTISTCFDETAKLASLGCN